MVLSGFRSFSYGVTKHSVVDSDPDASRGESIEEVSPPRICQLPPEILQHIFSYLDGQHLLSLCRTCKVLKEQAEQDYLWAELLRPHLPVTDFPENPYPSPSYRHLYLTHHPYWFLPRYKIWFSDEPYTGKLILVKFDARYGCIEGYRVASQRGPMTDLQWTHHPSVEIKGFNPHVYISRDDPVLSLSHDVIRSNVKENWRDAEIRMRVGSPTSKINASFSLSRDLPQKFLTASTDVWPPMTIPGMPRARASSGNKFQSKGHKPQKYSEISQTTFRLRNWSYFMQGFSALGVKISEEVATWSTLEPALYTPTENKPYQGIFVGDYAGHGCEFLLVIQTESAPLPVRRRSQGVGGEFAEAMMAMQREFLNLNPEPETSNEPVSAVSNEDDTIHRGALEGIKLTGDVNIPRGEHTFIADDIGNAGLIRIAQEEPFKGARIVRSRGHVAAQGFQDDTFIPSQLIMISPDLLAQYWVPFGHISYYRRVDLDEPLMAANDAPRNSI